MVEKMEFCGDCNNLLHPTCRANMEGNYELLLECKTCDFVGPATSNKIFSRKVIRKVEDTATAIADEIITDPTLPRSFKVECPQCGNNQAVFFMSPLKAGDSMTLFFVCCNERCKHRWTQ